MPSRTPSMSALGAINVQHTQASHLADVLMPGRSMTCAYHEWNLPVEGTYFTSGSTPVHAQTVTDKTRGLKTLVRLQYADIGFI